MVPLRVQAQINTRRLVHQIPIDHRVQFAMILLQVAARHRTGVIVLEPRVRRELLHALADLTLLTTTEDGADVTEVSGGWIILQELLYLLVSRFVDALDASLRWIVDQGSLTGQVGSMCSLKLNVWIAAQRTGERFRSSLQALERADFHRL